MFPLSTKITAVAVTTSMGLFLAAVAILLVVPLVQAVVEGRRPKLPELPQVLENLGIAVAIGGFTIGVTKVAAAGIAMMLAGAVLGYGRKAEGLHPTLRKMILICGVIGVGTLGEYYWIVN